MRKCNVSLLSHDIRLLNCKYTGQSQHESQCIPRRNKKKWCNDSLEESVKAATTLFFQEGKKDMIIRSGLKGKWSQVS